MANKIYRWVGSGNTGSTSANIFNWNTSGNWQLLKYLGNGLSGGWQFTPSTFCPGPLDTAYFGIPGPELLLNPNIPLSPVKSPCLFGGYAGTVGGGTWANSGNGANSGGATYSSGLLNLFVKSANMLGFGRTYGSYNDTASPLSKPMPLGGGLTSNDNSTDILQWINFNYPNMGVYAVVGSTLGDTTYTIPVEYTSSWDNINLKVYGSIVVEQHGGISGADILMGAAPGLPSSPIKFTFVKAFSPASGNFGATFGLTGSHSPEVKTVLSGYSARNIEINGGAFSEINLTPYAGGVREPGDVPFYSFVCPSFNFENMSVLKFYLSTINDNTISRAVKYADISLAPKVLVSPFYEDIPGAGNDFSTYTNDRSTKIYGQNLINTVFADLFPGNTLNINNIQGSVELDMDTGESIRSLGFGRNSNTLVEETPLNISRKNISIDHMNDSGDSGYEARKYLTGHPDSIYIRDNSRIIQGIPPGSHVVLIGGDGVTTPINIESLISTGSNSAEETPVIKILGNANINNIIGNGGTRISFFGHVGSANIGSVKLDSNSVLDTRNPLNEQSQLFFGQFSSSGVCGGIESNIGQNSTDIRGKILLENGERLFNVSTSKKGLLTRSTETSTPVDAAPPIIATKS